MKTAQITIKDLARELNIATSTVSRALNNHPHVHKKTKEAVVNLAKKLGYTPNSIASSLRSDKTNTIGVIIPEIVHFFFSTVIAGIQEVANKAGYTIMICPSNENYTRELLDTKALAQHRIDGLLVSFSNKTTNFDHFIELKKQNIPIVFFDRKAEGLQTSTVVVEDYEGARKATKHLLEQGCKRIVHLAGSEHLNIGQDRLQGYLDVMKEEGLTADQRYMTAHGSSVERGYECTKNLLKLPNPPDGIFATNDMVALGAMKAIKEKGLEIPKDIAIIGFSNWQFSDLTEPRLSTISQPGAEVGKMAMRLLLEEINSNSDQIKYEHIVLPTKIIIRDSSLRGTKSSNLSIPNETRLVQ